MVVIQDLDGAAPEPTRRSHVVALSAATAGVAIVLLLALFAPAPRTASRLAAAPEPSATTGAVAVLVSSSAWVPTGPVSPPRDGVTTTVCLAGPGSNPTIHLLFDGSGELMAAYTGRTTGRFIAMRSDYWGPGWRLVPCDASDVFAPRLNRAR